MIEDLHVSGFLSLAEARLRPERLNILIGENGSGKSNLLAVFDLLDMIFSNRLASLNAHAMVYGTASRTRKIAISIQYDGGRSYEVELSVRDDGSLAISRERLLGQDLGGDASSISRLFEIEKDGDNGLGPEAAYLISRPWRVYRFKSVSAVPTAVADAAFLHPDGSNIAAVLHRIRTDWPKSYRMIMMTVRKAAPYIEDFYFEPAGENGEMITIRWKERGLDSLLYACHLSAGTLRFVSLATVLLAPAPMRAETILIDEPELGMHPGAMAVLCELLECYAVKRQVLIATQSVDIVSNFDPENIIVVSKDDKGSHFDHLDPKPLQAWLDADYSLGDLWQKNILESSRERK